MKNRDSNWGNSRLTPILALVLFSATLRQGRPQDAAVLRTTEKTLFARPVSAQAASRPAQDHDSRVLTCVALGDSTTAPRIVNGEPLRVYASILEERLVGEGTIPRVVNRGVPGSTTEDALRRIAGGVIPLRPAIVIVQFGINDAAVDVWKKPPATASRIPLSDYETNLRAIVAQLKEIGTEVVLMTPNPMRWTDQLRKLYGAPPYDPSDPDGLNILLKGYAEAVRRLAASEKLPMVDVYRAFQEYPKTNGRPADELLLDGMHPNAKGQQLIADLIMERLNAPPR